LIRQAPRLGEDFLRRAALFRTAGHGHDTITAELVAADLDPQIGLKRRGSHGGIAQGIECLVAAADTFHGSIAAA